jgi:hypothetical protein
MSHAQKLSRHRMMPSTARVRGVVPAGHSGMSMCQGAVLAVEAFISRVGAVSLKPTFEVLGSSVHADVLASLLLYLNQNVPVTFNQRGPMLTSLPVHTQSHILMFLATVMIEGRFPELKGGIAALTQSLCTAKQLLSPLCARIVQAMAEHCDVALTTVDPVQVHDVPGFMEGLGHVAGTVQHVASLNPCSACTYLWAHVQPYTRLTPSECDSLSLGGSKESEPSEPNFPGIQEVDEQAALEAWLHSAPVGAMPPAVQSQLATLIAQYGPEDAVWKSLFQQAPDTAVLTMVRCSCHMYEHFQCT